jgi:hypothetical protein
MLQVVWRNQNPLPKRVIVAKGKHGWLRTIWLQAPGQVSSYTTLGVVDGGQSFYRPKWRMLP